MTWLRLDDNFTDHPKVERLSDSGFRAHVRALCYAARFATDGAIPKNKLGRLGVTKRILFDLLRTGLWDERDDEFVIHDYLKYNPSKELRESWSAAGTAAANARWKPKRNADRNASPSPNERTSPNGRSSPLPPASGGNAERAARARNGSRRKRDVAALEATPRDYEGSIERMRQRVGRRA